MALNGAVGIFGGTFAPIHNAHLRLAIEVGEQLDLPEVRIIPCAAPPHRPAPTVDAARRLRWVRLAIAGEARLVADDRELRRAGPSYTYDTLAGLRAELGPRVSIVLMIGGDSAVAFDTWHRWQDILGLAHLVLVGRPAVKGSGSRALRQAFDGCEAASARALHERPAGLWYALEIPPLAISSTRIRERLAAGRSLRGLVPAAVLEDFTPEDIRLLIHDEDPRHRSR